MQTSRFLFRLAGLAGLAACIVPASGCRSPDEDLTCDVFGHVEDLFLHGDFLQARGSLGGDSPNRFRVVQLAPEGGGETTVEREDWVERVGDLTVGPRHFARVTSTSLELFEVDDNGAPTPIGETRFDEIAAFLPSAWGAHDGVLYFYGLVGDGVCGIWKIDLSDPTSPGAPSQVASRACDEGTDLVRAFGETLFVEASRQQLFVLDLAKGEEIFTAPWHGDAYGELHARAATDGDVVVFSPESGDRATIVYPRLDPPRAIEAPFGDLATHLLAVRDGVVYASQFREGVEYLSSWDLSNPDAITLGETQVLLEERGSIDHPDDTLWGISDSHIVIGNGGPGAGTIYVVPLGTSGALNPFQISAPPAACR